MHGPTKIAGCILIAVLCAINCYILPIYCVCVVCMFNAKLEIFLQTSFVFFLFSLHCFFERDWYNTCSGVSTTVEEGRARIRCSIVESCCLCCSCNDCMRRLPSTAMKRHSRFAAMRTVNTHAATPYSNLHLQSQLNQQISKSLHYELAYTSEVSIVVWWLHNMGKSHIIEIER